MASNEKTNDPAQNPDPITKAPGSHPIGTGVGAAAGGAAVAGGTIAAGAAMGSVVGPIGTAIGAAVGAVAGAYIGKGVAEGVNPTAEHEYWRGNYSKRPYVAQGSSYDEYAPAYQHGWESRSQYPGKRFDEVQSQVGQGWNQARGKSTLSWDRAMPAVKDSWDRVSQMGQQE